MLGQLLNKLYDYQLILCSPNKTELVEIDYTDINYSPVFNGYDELTFSVSYYENGIAQIKDERFDLIKSAYLILLNIKENDTIIKQKYFSIINPSTSESDLKVTKSVSCVAYEYQVFNKKLLRGYKDQVKKLYDIEGNEGIINLMLSMLYGTWQVGFIDPIFINKYHTFNFDKSTFTDVFKQLQTDYNCIFIFDNVNNLINIYSPDNIGINTGFVLSNENYIKSITSDPNLDHLVTRLYVYGKNNTTIAKFNITGNLFIENYDYLIANGYFSDSLKTAWQAYEAKKLLYQNTFNGYVESLNTNTAILLQKQTELVDLQIDKTLIEDALDVEKNAHSRNTPTYDGLYNSLVSKNGEISSKQSEIDSIQSTINEININIQNLSSQLSYANNFTSSQLEELVQFVWEDSLEMNNVSDEQQLYNYSVSYLALKSQMPLSINVDSISIFDTQEAQLDWDKVNIGDYVNLHCPKLGYNYLPIRIVGYSHNKMSNSLTINLSNTNELNNELNRLNKIFAMSAKTTATVEINKNDYSKYIEEREKLLFSGVEIDTEDTPIKAGDNVINRRGFMGADIGGTGSIQILNDKIIFSNDDFLTYYTLLSANGLYLETDNGKSRTLLTPQYGFQIDHWDSTSSAWDNIFYISSTDGSLHIDGGYIECTTQDLSNKINIDPSVGILIQHNISTPEFPVWEDMFKANTDGTLNLAKQLIIGDWEDLSDKSIYFFNSGTDYCYLRLAETTGTFSIFNFQNIDIFSTADMEINALGDLYIVGTEVEINTYSNGDLLLHSSGNIYIESLNGFDVIMQYDTYLGDNTTVNNLVATLGDLSGFATTTWVSSNFASSGHSHSYATSSDISSAISAHVSAYH